MAVRNASRQMPSRVEVGISSARRFRLWMISRKPKYAGVSMATVSPGLVTARRQRLSASVQPTVTTSSSWASGTPPCR